MTNPIIEQTVKAIEEAGTEGLAAICPEAGPMIRAVTLLLSDCSSFSVLLTLAFVFGTICAGIEGEPVEAEKDGHLITFEDRLQLFDAQVRAVYKDAMKYRAEFDATQQPRRN